MKNNTKLLNQLEREFENEIKKDKQAEKNLEHAKNNLGLAQKTLSERTISLVTLMKNPAELSFEFDNAIYLLKDSFDRVKLPGIAAREFFEEIADEQDCICGRKIDANISEVIKKRADKYLGSEEVAILNAMKSEIKSRINGGQTISSSLIHKHLEDVENAQNKVSTAQQKLDIITQNASENDPEIKKIHEQIKELKEKEGRLKVEMEKYKNRKNESDNCWNLKILKRNLEKANSDLAEATGTIIQKKKKDILQDILNTIIEQSRLSLSKTVCSIANEKIEKLMPYNKIRIEKIDRSLKLVDKEGGSAGETLAVGYAFLSSLLSNSDHCLPSVVDSPSGPIDLDIRPEIGKLIPKIGEQFICFIISSERQNFITPLNESATEEPLFLTLFRKGNRSLESSAKSVTGFYESGDGIWVNGKSYFDNFHTDKE